MKSLKKLLTVSLLALLLANLAKTGETAADFKHGTKIYVSANPTDPENEVDIIKPTFYFPKNIKTV